MKTKKKRLDVILMYLTTFLLPIAAQTTTKWFGLSIIAWVASITINMVYCTYKDKTDELAINIVSCLLIIVFEALLVKLAMGIFF